MIKHAEVQNAYLQGRQAAMIKLSQVPNVMDQIMGTEGDKVLMTDDQVAAMLAAEGGSPSIPNPAAGVLPPPSSESAPSSTTTPTPSPKELSMYQRALAGLRAVGENQMGVLGDIGLTGRDLYRGDKSLAAYGPRQLATLENLSRAGMLAGAGGGAYLGGMDPRAAAIASAGALGGGLVGGNLGQGINAALGQFGYGGDRGTATSIGGALGGLGGGLGAGYLA